jgi:hypothetical protein
VAVVFREEVEAMILKTAIGPRKTQKARKYLMDYAAVNYSPKSVWLHQYKLPIYIVAFVFFVPFVDELI